jgi:hypothetical protein
MKHGEAIASQAPERYLLGEMTKAEREEFEDHYFSCELCAEDVRAGAALAGGVKSLYNGAPPSRLRSAVPARSSWIGGLRRLPAASMVPAAAAVGFATLAGYQSLVMIPAARQAAETRVAAGVPLHGNARALAAIPVSIHRGEALPPFVLDVNSAAPGDPLICEVSDPSGELRLRAAFKAPPAGVPLIVVMPPGAVSQAGKWSVQLRTPQGADSGRYAFQLQIN